MCCLAACFRLEIKVRYRVDNRKVVMGILVWIEFESDVERYVRYAVFAESL
jgi:hypothetical protein